MAHAFIIIVVVELSLKWCERREESSSAIA
jgi:hypothetical protein